MMKAFIGLVIAVCGLNVARVEGQTKEFALPPIQTAGYDDHARFQVNGKPFFPILLYGAPIEDDAVLAQCREFGFNVLTCRPDAAEPLAAKGFYAAVHGTKNVVGMSSILLAIGADSPALYFKKDLLAQTAEANAKSSGAIPNRPVMNAIGYWEDEPAGVIAGKLPAKALYEDLVAAIDVSAPYLYPVPYQPVASVGEAVARARQATGGKKPILPILQLFAWETAARYPTPAELRCMTFLALVEGASGIGYYTYKPVTGHPKATLPEIQPELWQSVKQLNREVAEIGPLLLKCEGKEPPTVTLAPGSVTAVKFKASGRNGGFPAVVVNSSPLPQEVKLVLSGKGEAARLLLSDDRALDFQGGAAALSLKPFEVVIVRRAIAP